jgi:hypothetical protein
VGRVGRFSTRRPHRATTTHQHSDDASAGHALRRAGRLGCLVWPVCCSKDSQESQPPIAEASAAVKAREGHPQSPGFEPCLLPGARRAPSLCAIAGLNETESFQVLQLLQVLSRHAWTHAPTTPVGNAVSSSLESLWGQGPEALCQGRQQEAASAIRNSSSGKQCWEATLWGNRRPIRAANPACPITSSKCCSLFRLRRSRPAAC